MLLTVKKSIVLGKAPVMPGTPQIGRAAKMVKEDVRTIITLWEA